MYRRTLLINFRSSIDIESVKQSDRFDSLDVHAKAIFDTLSTNHTRIHEVIQSEAAKSMDMYQQATITILRTQEGMHGEVKQSLDALDDQAKEALQALSDNRELLQGATVTILSTQEESQAIVKQAFELMDVNSRAEHEATRRELEQMKRAIAQIEQDMVRRDQELKELLFELSKSTTEKERKKLQEKSNAVTVALCALVTIYQGLEVFTRHPIR